MKIFTITFLFLSCIIGKLALTSEFQIRSKKYMNKEIINGTISIGDNIFEVEYLNNPTSKSLIQQMPFTVDLEDYAGIEKIFYPSEKLSEEKALEGAKPAKGDIMYYAPWGDVAIFYKDFRYASGLIALGHIDDIETFIESLANNKQMVSFKRID